MLINTVLFLILNIRKFNYKNYITIEIIFAIINVGLTIKISLYDLLLTMTLLISFTIIIEDYFSG